MHKIYPILDGMSQIKIPPQKVRGWDALHHQRFLTLPRPRPGSTYPHFTCYCANIYIAVYKTWKHRPCSGAIETLNDGDHG